MGLRPCIPCVKNLRDVGMVHHGQRLPLGLEARYDLAAVHARFDDLEGDATFDRLSLFGHPHFAEPAFAELLQQRVPPDHRCWILGGCRVCHERERQCCRWLLHEGVLLEVIGQQGFHSGALQWIRAAHPFEKGRAFLCRRHLQRIEKDLLIRTARGFV
jgi:hypothetical protein